MQPRVPHITEESSVVVVGLGKSGRSAIDFFLSIGASVSLSDSGTGSLTDKQWLADRGVSYEFGSHSASLLLQADIILISPGVPFYLPILEEARQNGIAVIGELALAADYLRTKVVAVTGTNGKTTVTTLLGELFGASGRDVFVGGNIGTPLTDYLMTAQIADWLILEVSSFQLDAAAGFRPDIGILLNVSPDHLDRYPSMQDYALSKMNLFAWQGAGDIAIFNCDDDYSMDLLAANKNIGKADCYFFGHDLVGKNGALIDKAKIKLSGDIADAFDLSATDLNLSPNCENGAAAILAARKGGCSVSGMKAGLSQFKSLAHRMTLVREWHGVKYVNDSKATNIGAVHSALSAIDARIILIAGGRDKGGDYHLLADLVGEKVISLLLIGEAQGKMAAIFNEFTDVELCDSLEAAVSRAKNIAGAGDVVLLSPACSSFDMFSGYGERGNVFESLVKGFN